MTPNLFISARQNQRELLNPDTSLRDWHIYLHENHQESTIYVGKYTTVDGRNPAPPGTYQTLQIMG